MAGEQPTDQIPQGGEDQYRLLLDNVKDYAIFMLHPDGKIASWNTGAKRILGYDESEIVGQPFARVFLPEDVAERQPEHELRLAAETGRSEDERWHLRKCGSRFWASGVLTALWDSEGQLRGYAKLLRDITERKRMEEELAEANRRKDEFIAVLSHELRNPLTPILNALQIIRREAADATTVRQAGDMAERQLRRLVRLVDDLLDVSRITGGKLQLRRERVELRTVVGHAVESTRPFIESRKHELSVALPQESLWVDADPLRLEQVLVNLLNNAAKYTEPGGQIKLTLAKEGTQAIFRIKDTGIGILSEMLPRIFDLFVQAVDRAQGGLGIGLTLVKRLVEMHGGTVEAHSEGVGKGSEFCVRLPTIPEVMGLPPEALPTKAEGTRKALRVLVVDDNVDSAESLALLLRLFGHEVQVAHTGPKALQAAAGQQPEVVLLDISLPGMDGYQVAGQLRQQTGLEKVCLIAVTGHASEAARQRSQEAGFDYHFVKPVDPTKLQDLLLKVGRAGEVAR